MALSPKNSITETMKTYFKSILYLLTFHIEYGYETLYFDNSGQIDSYVRSSNYNSNSISNNNNYYCLITLLHT